MPLNKNSKSPEDLFTEFKVKPKEHNLINWVTDRLDWLSFRLQMNHQTSITLKKNIDPASLPYADVYTQEKLQKIKAPRLNSCSLFWRGEDRPIGEILNVGGFQPNITTEDNPTYSEKTLDVQAHRENTEGSGLVSFTSYKPMAQEFGRVYAQKSHQNEYYLYLAKTTGAIGPDKAAEDYVQMELEQEYSVPGGIDAEDIVSYRRCNVETGSCSSIFLANRFIHQYPHLVKTVLKENLAKNEELEGSVAKTNMSL
jgi:hypothetical protein